MTGPVLDATLAPTKPGDPPLELHDGVLMVDSRAVAASFGKEHRRVLQSIRELHCSAEFRQRNFVPFKIKDLTGESTSHVLLTRDGFTFLAMGFTGPAAAVFKEAYIARFNAMEEELRRVSVPAVPQTYAAALLEAGRLAMEVEAQAATIAVLEPRAAALDRIAETDGTWCVRDAAKLLQTAEKDLWAYLKANGWIYRRESGGDWIAYASRCQSGHLTHKAVPVEPRPGLAWTTQQVRVTTRGLAALALALGQPAPLALPAPARA